MLNEGRYTARASDIAWNESRNGNIFSVVRFTVEQSGDDDTDGRTCTKQFHFTDKALERTLEDLRVCGYAGDDPLEITPDNIGRLLPNAVSITVEHEQYTDGQGEERTAAKIKWINDLNRQAKPLEGTADRASLSRFQVDLKARIAGLNAKAKASGTGGVKVNGSRPKPPPSREPAPQECGGVDDDSIPF